MERAPHRHGPPCSNASRISGESSKQPLSSRQSLPRRDLGTLEPGKLADMAIVRRRPLTDIKAAAHIRFVTKDGKLHSIADLMAAFAD